MAEDDQSKDDTLYADEEPSMMPTYMKAGGIVVGLNIIDFVLLSYVINGCTSSVLQVVLTFILVIANLFILDWMRRKLIDNTQIFLIFLGIWAVLLAIVYILSAPIACNASGYTITCVPSAGFSCAAPALNVSGGNLTLSVLVGQSTNHPVYNIGVACLASGSNAAVQYATFEYPNTGSGNVTHTQQGTAVALNAGASEPIKQLTCYNAPGNPLKDSPGAIFIGVIYLNYTLTAAGPSAENPWQTATVGTISFRVP